MRNWNDNDLPVVLLRSIADVLCSGAPAHNGRYSIRERQKGENDIFNSCAHSWNHRRFVSDHDDHLLSWCRCCCYFLFVLLRVGYSSDRSVLLLVSSRCAAAVVACQKVLFQTNGSWKRLRQRQRQYTEHLRGKRQEKQDIDNQDDANELEQEDLFHFWDYFWRLEDRKIH